MAEVMGHFRVERAIDQRGGQLLEESIGPGKALRLTGSGKGLFDEFLGELSRSPGHPRRRLGSLPCLLGHGHGSLAE
ncbi:MAG: hypothetical protein ACO3JL_20800 [Myxococcota bacterium]